MTEKIQIGIVDDHGLFRDGLKTMINLEENYNVVFSVPSVDPLLQCLDAGQLPDVLLLDIRLPGIKGLEVLPKLVKKYKLKVLMISMYGDAPYIVNAIKRGAAGYLEKEVDSDELFRALQSVHETSHYLNDEMTDLLVQGLKSRQFVTYEDKPLSPAELELLEMIVQGFTSKQISGRIWKSHRTVEGMRQKMFRKTGTKNIAMLVAWAFREGIID